MESLVRELLGVIRNVNKKQTSAYDTSATVKRVDVEKGIAWVHIPGGVDETPVSLTVDASVGDDVQVRVGGGRAWIVGNASAPPTDDTTANHAKVTAYRAQDTANDANKAATDALQSAETARSAARTAETYAEEARTTANAVHGIAVEAKTDAGVAKTAANNAMKGLSQVEDVVGTLNWLTEHSKLTEDTTPVEGKSYYVKNQDNTFTLVTDVTGKNPAQEGWYEMDEAIQNYIMSHLALTDVGLYVLSGKADSWKVLISPGSVSILDENNNPVAQYSSSIILGNTESTHMEINPDSVELYGVGRNLLGYIGLGKASFPMIEVTQSQYITDGYVWRKTPSGSLGLYGR